MIVSDLDGTLADGKDREHFITGETKDWDAYFAACGNDTPMVAGWAIQGLVALGYDVEIWSGRSEGPGGVNRRTTNRWLYENFSFLVPELTVAVRSGYIIRRLRMRAHKDYTPDEQLKLGWLQEIRAAGGTVDLVFDDRQKVVDMWRANGVPCFQVAPGDF